MRILGPLIFLALTAYGAWGDPDAPYRASLGIAACQSCTTLNGGVALTARRTGSACHPASYPSRDRGRYRDNSSVAALGRIPPTIDRDRHHSNRRA
jgi:hypothetical protein